MWCTVAVAGCGAAHQYMPVQPLALASRRKLILLSGENTSAAAWMAELDAVLPMIRGASAGLHPGIPQRTKQACVAKGAAEPCSDIMLARSAGEMLG